MKAINIQRRRLMTSLALSVLAAAPGRLLGPRLPPRPSHPPAARGSSWWAQAWAAPRPPSTSSSSTRILTSRSSTATRTSSATTARPSSSRAPSRWRTSRSPTTRSPTATVCAWIGTRSSASTRTAGPSSAKRPLCLRQAHRLARHRAALRRHPGLQRRARRDEDPERLDRGPADAAPRRPAQGHAPGRHLLPRRTA